MQRGHLLAACNAALREIECGIDRGRAAVSRERVAPALRRFQLLRLAPDRGQRVALEAFLGASEPVDRGAVAGPCDWIFGNVTEYINSSDRMELYYSYAFSLIEKNRAYVCTCSQEEFKKFVESKTDCPCRKKSSEENVKDWEKMVDVKGFKPGEAVLRFKSELGMQDPNPAMRDFPLARIVLTNHPKQGTKYRVWPLMNLAVPVDDIEFGMTHIIRGKDHRDNAKRQRMIFDVFGKKFPWTYFMGRIKFKDLILSKRKLNEMISSGDVSGEEDEKIPTIASLRKRGYKPEAFAKFAEQRGLTEVDKVLESREFFEILDGFNK